MTTSLVILAVLLSGAIQPAAPQRVAIVYQDKPLYESAAAALRQQLQADQTACDVIKLPTLDTADRRAALEKLRSLRPTLIATAGPTLTTDALEQIPDLPVVFFVVPNALDAPFLQPDYRHRGRVFGVSSDPSPEEQVRWLKQLTPSAGTVAVLHSARTPRTPAALRDAAAELNLRLVPLKAESGEFGAALQELDSRQVDAVLMIPDAGVYNAPNVEALLLWGLRQKHAVYGFSESIVSAGALSGIYVEPADVGRETAALIKQVLHERPENAGEPRYAAPVRRAINLRTAELIQVSVEQAAKSSSVKLLGK